MSVKPTVPQTITLASARFALRDLEPSDVSQRMCAWLADPVKARMINSSPGAVTVDHLRAYIASHDRITGHVLGIFDKATGALLGFWAVYIDWDLGEFQLSVLIGERSPKAVNARAETQRELLKYMFDTLGLETLRCSVLTRNEAIGDRIFGVAGVSPEHTSYNPSATDEAFVEIRHYRISKDQWRHLRARVAGDLAPFEKQLGI